MEIRVTGIVQGVGFRPFVHRLARENALTGWVRNTNTGVEIRLEGRRSGAEEFVRQLKEHPPVLSRIETVTVREMNEDASCEAFSIVPSERPMKVATRISPDIATCPDCLRELMDPKDRRYHFPFINCTNCGPRFTIVKETPYDRPRTTMAPFAMCPACEAEYHDIEDRRYHAQPDCCPVCGPSLWYEPSREAEDVQGKPAGTGMMHGRSSAARGRLAEPETAIRAAQEALLSGKIVAVKGLGGFHLAVRADDPAAAQRLRERKERDRKPFAVMCADLAAVKEICLISEEEEKLLTSPARPIVLLRKREADTFFHLSENRRIGVMLPYTPIHHLLLDGGLRALVMTSANLSDRPIIYKNDEALRELAGIADGFLMHDREIETRCDDSVLFAFRGGPYFVRRSRGFVPEVLHAAGICGGILACGAEQKATFAISEAAPGDLCSERISDLPGREEPERRHETLLPGNADPAADIFLSQHIGDLKNIETLTEYERQIRHFEKLFSLRPKMLVCDLHPDYLSTDYALRRAEEDGVPLVRVQHHFAHMLSCMADNALSGPAIGIIWDGTGYGTDGTVWGGEFLVGDDSGFARYGSLRPIPLPGGDAAVKEPWRVAAALLSESGVLDGWRESEQSAESGVLAERSVSFKGRTSEVRFMKNRMPAASDATVFLQGNETCCSQLNDPAGTKNSGICGYLDKPHTFGRTKAHHLCEYLCREKGEAVLRMLDRGTNCPAATSVGRLFDGVSAMLGICMEASYEGEGAVLLEAAAEETDEVYSYLLELNSLESLNIGNTKGSGIKTGTDSAGLRLDYRPMIRAIEEDRKLGVPAGICAGKFMNTLCGAAAVMTRRIAEVTGIRTVVLSGGVFQNQYILFRITERLEAAGLSVYTHRRVSANDEGICLGQLAAASRN